MALAQIGPATGFMEALATAVGAGMVLSGFLVGGMATAFRWPKPTLEEWALAGGSVGGGVAVLLVLIDLTMS
jgi:hypothetical protein